MKKHKKRWNSIEKLEIINYSKIHGSAQASREFNVSTASIYNWTEAYNKYGESGLRKKKEEASTAENRRLKRENDELKKLVAEKELQLRIQAEMLKKSR